MILLFQTIQFCTLYVLKGFLQTQLWRVYLSSDFEITAGQYDSYVYSAKNKK